MSRFITIIRPEFMEFCKDACRSAAFNHLLFRIAGKSKDQPKEKIKNGEILWYAKTEQITEEMANAWGTCKVRKEVNALINMGIIGRQSNPAWGADRTKHFCFGQKECKKFLALCEKHKLCIVHLGLPPEVVHLIYLSNANDTSIKCICPIHQMQPIHLSDAFDISIRAIPIELPTIEGHTKEEDTRVAIAFAHAPLAPVDFLPEETHEHDAQASRPAADHDPLPGSSSDAHALVGATADVEEGAHRIPAIKLNGAPNGQLNTLTASASIPGEPENSPLSAQTRHSHIPSSLQGTDGAATTGGSEPRASGKRKGRKVTQEPEPISQEALRILDEWDVLMKRQCPRTEGEKGTIAAAQALIPSHPSRDDLKAVWQFLFTSNPDWYRAHGVSIQDIEKNFGKWQSLQVKPDAPATNGKPDGPVIKRWSAAEARAYRKALEAKQGDLQA